jgi:phosphoserine phosphatase
MSLQNKVPREPMDAIIFDCDGTLSHIEGIDELAIAKNVSTEVKALTAVAMGSTGINPEIYEKRLNLVLPTHKQIQDLGQKYYEHKAPDLERVLSTFLRLNKQIYIVSAGLYPAIADFATLLKINHANIFAVPIFFDESGNYQNFDLGSPLVREMGKRTIVEQIKQKHQNIVYVGDGLNDLETYDLVTRFVGYGGAFYRKNIAERCEFYISVPSMAPLLSLCLTDDEVSKLNANELDVFQKGKDLYGLL